MHAPKKKRPGKAAGPLKVVMVGVFEEDDSEGRRTWLIAR
jgi:hypothetical protein